MSTKKITQLQTATDITASDFIQVVDIEDGGMAPSGTNKKATAQLLANELGKLTNVTATGSTTARSLVNRFADTVNVKDFGAVGDGVTNDTSAIQTAIAASAGNTVYFPSGTYLVSGATANAALTLPVAGVCLMGDGKFSSTIKCLSASAILAAVDAEKIEIRDLGFDGVSTARLGWQRAIAFRGVLKSSIKNCYFYRLGDSVINYGKTGFGGSDAIPNGSRQPEDIEVSGNLFEDCYGSAAVISKFVGMKQTIISNNEFKDSCSVAISIESEGGTVSELAEKIVVSGNIIDGLSYARTSGLSNVAWGISIAEQAKIITVSGNVVNDVNGSTIAAGIIIGTSAEQDDTFASDVSVVGNTVTNISAGANRGHGILLQTGDANVTGVTISGNIIADCVDGISFQSAAGSKTIGVISQMSVIGNVIRNCTEFGLFHVSVGGAGETAVVNSCISNNVISGSTSHGATLKLTNSVVSGNVFYQNGGIGLTLQSGSSVNIISNNVSFNSGLDGFQINGDLTTMIGNTAINNGQTAGTSYGIYLLTGSNGILSNNRCSDTQGSPTQDYGIRAPNGTTVRNNEYIGNAVAPNFNGIGNYNTGTYDAGLNRTA